MAPLAGVPLLVPDKPSFPVRRKPAEQPLIPKMPEGRVHEDQKPAVDYRIRLHSPDPRMRLKWDRRGVQDREERHLRLRVSASDQPHPIRHLSGIASERLGLPHVSTKDCNYTSALVMREFAGSMRGWEKRGERSEEH